MSEMVLARLGVYMRTVASQLEAEQPISIQGVARALHVSEKYAAETMARLAKLGITIEVEGGWIRGPRWHQYANRHAWPKTNRPFGLEFG